MHTEVEQSRDRCARPSEEAGKTKPRATVDFAIEQGERLVVTARTRRGRPVGRLDAGPMGIDRRLAVSYLSVESKLQGQGIGEGLLRTLLANLPSGVDRIHFLQVCSQGALRLIERVVGPAIPDGTTATAIERLPEFMDHRTLRRSRGANLVVDVPANFAGDRASAVCPQQ